MKLGTGIAFILTAYFFWQYAFVQPDYHLAMWICATCVWQLIALINAFRSDRWESLWMDAHISNALTKAVEGKEYSDEA